MSVPFLSGHRGNIVHNTLKMEDEKENKKWEGGFVREIMRQVVCVVQFKESWYHTPQSSPWIMHVVGLCDLLFSYQTQMLINIEEIFYKIILPHISLIRRKWERREYNGHLIKFDRMSNLDRSICVQICALI